MEPSGAAKRVTIFVGHTETEHSKHGYVRILELLKAEGAAGATAFKSIAAFGARAHVQTIGLADVMPDLPVMIVWIDTAERVERILPRVQELVTEGLIAVEDTSVLLYTTRAVPDLPSAIKVADVMTHDVVAVHPDTPMQALVTDLVQHQLRVVPVVDAERHVVGIITNGDLVRRGGLPARLNLMRSFDTPELHGHLSRLAEPHREAREVMTSPAITVHPELPVREAAALMCRRKLKRLPVVDARARLVGIVSRIDLLRSVAGATRTVPADDHRSPGTDGAAPIRTVMSDTVPVVDANAPLQEVVDVVLSTRLSRAVVVDAKRHVLGVVTDAELIERLNPKARPGLVAMFTRRLPFVPGSKEAEETFRHVRGTRARDVMETDIAVAHEDEPIRDVLAAMLTKGRKIVPVVNGTGELVGMADRAALLQVLVGSSGAEENH